MPRPPAFLLLILVLSGLSACGESEGDVPAPAAAPEKAVLPSMKGEFQEIARRLESGGNPYLGRDRVIVIREFLKEPGLTDYERCQAIARLAQELLKQGEEQEALRVIDEVWRRIFEKRGVLGELLPKVAEIRGLVLLRLAEVQNCIERHNAECCIFPLSGEGVHAVREPAVAASSVYGSLLKRDPDHLRFRWLLNVLGMALGVWPEKVPPRLLIPPSAFSSPVDVGRFVDVAPRLGLDTMSACGGVIVEDFDGDGFLDVVTSEFNPRGPLVFKVSDGRGGYVDRSRESRLDDQLGGLNCIAGDYDNDGDPDILVLRGAWLLADGQIRNSLLERRDDGVFVDVTRKAGLAEPAWPTQAATWADFDNDGWLDLFVGNEGIVEGRDLPAQLSMNRRDGTFVDVAGKAGVLNERYCKGVCAGDYDNDGDMDIYVSNIGPNRLYRNNGDGTFTDVAAAAGVLNPKGRSFACWFFDYDNDGWLDLFVGAYDATVEDVAAHALGRPDRATRPCLYRNNGDGTFTDVAKSSGLDLPLLPMGANFGDIDNDGWLDIYLSTGDPEFDTLVPNVMLRNDRGRRFQDVTFSGGFGHLQKGHGVAFADMDNDGDQDIYNELGGFYPGDAYQNVLLENPGHGNHFVTIVLQGVRSNRSAVGARIRIVVEDSSGEREIHRAVGCVSSFGGSPLRQETGLGRAKRIKRIEVWWPASGLRQVFEDVPLDRLVRIREGGQEPEVRELVPAPFQ